MPSSQREVRKIFSAVNFSLTQFLVLVSALRARYEILSWNPITFRITPELPGNGVVKICAKVFARVGAVQARRLLGEYSKPVVHGVHQAQVFCGFTNLPLAQWPQEHRFVGPFVPGMGTADQITCPVCSRVVWREMRRRMAKPAKE